MSGKQRVRSPKKKSPTKKATRSSSAKRTSPKSALSLLQIQAATQQIPHFGMDVKNEAQMRLLFGNVTKLTPATVQRIPLSSHFAAVLAQSTDGVPYQDRKVDSVFDLQVFEKSDDGRTLHAYMTVPGDPFRIVKLTEQKGVLRFGTGREPVYVFKR